MLSPGRAGAVRYYEVVLTEGRDGLALPLLYEQTRPFMSPRFVAAGPRLDGVSYHSPGKFVNRLLTSAALRAACYLGGTAAVVAPDGDFSAAAALTLYCGQVRCISPAQRPVPAGAEWQPGLDALDGCGIVLSFSGLAGLGLPRAADLAHAVIFTAAPEHFPAGLVIDGALPRLPPTLHDLPDGVERTAFLAACWELNGLYGLGELPPLRLFSRGRPVGFDDVTDAVS